MANDKVKCLFNGFMDKKDDIFKRIEKIDGVICDDMIYPTYHYTGEFVFLAITLKNHELVHSIQVSHPHRLDANYNNDMYMAFIFKKKLLKDTDRDLRRYQFKITGLNNNEILDRIIEITEEYFSGQFFEDKKIATKEKEPDCL